jgi:hypothetical protein
VSFHQYSKSALLGANHCETAAHTVLDVDSTSFWFIFGGSSC